VKVKRDWHNKQNWRQLLRLDMTKTELRDLFGEPQNVSRFSDVEDWEYGTGDIKFDVNDKHPDGALFSWSEPQ